MQCTMTPCLDYARWTNLNQDEKDKDSVDLWRKPIIIENPCLVVPLSPYEHSFLSWSEPTVHIFDCSIISITSTHIFLHYSLTLNISREHIVYLSNYLYDKRHVNINSNYKFRRLYKQVIFQEIGYQIKYNSIKWKYDLIQLHEKLILFDSLITNTFWRT